MEQAFKNWAEKNPQYWNEDEAVGAIVALSDTWPCLKKSN